MYGVRIFNQWLSGKLPEPITKPPSDLLRLRNDELNVLLAEFIHVIRKPNGENYAPESIYYLCLGISEFFPIDLSNPIRKIFFPSRNSVLFARELAC